MARVTLHLLGSLLRAIDRLLERWRARRREKQIRTADTWRPGKRR